jgi:hypothetical protein
MWDLWCTKWHWDRFLSWFFGFPLSISFHHRSPNSYHLGDEQYVRQWQQCRDVVSPHKIKQKNLTVYGFCQQLDAVLCLCTMLYWLLISFSDIKFPFSVNESGMEKFKEVIWKLQLLHCITSMTSAKPLLVVSCKALGRAQYKDQRL